MHAGYTGAGMFPGRCFGLAAGIGEFQTSHWVSTSSLAYNFGVNVETFWWDLGVVGTGHSCGGTSWTLVHEDPTIHEAPSQSDKRDCGISLNYLRTLERSVTSNYAPLHGFRDE